MADWVGAAVTALENSRDARDAGFQAWFGVVRLGMVQSMIWLLNSDI
jgi:hypothetical protein